MKMKKYVIISSAFLLLCGCAQPKNQLQFSPNQTPVMEKRDLIGRSAGEVIETFGTPRTVLTEKPHQVWTYRKNQCITLVYFDESERVCFAEERGTCPAVIALNEMKENNNGTEGDA